MQLETKSEFFNQESILDILGCKWTIRIIGKILSGLNRPSEIKKHIPGLTAKVLNQRLKKLEREGVLIKKSYPGYPLHVEYLMSSDKEEILSIVEGFIDSGISIEHISETLSCKWMLKILSALYKSPMQSKRLKESIRGISYKVLSNRLRKLGRMNLIHRKVIDTRPPGVVYSLKEDGVKFTRFMTKHGLIK